MIIIEAHQGSTEWLEIRSRHFTASEAPAMLGLSKYKTRQALLREKTTGLTEEVDANKQRLFDAGHDAEDAARPLAEAYLQEDLFPATGTAEIDGLPLLASFDGLNMEETLVWENKLASAAVEAMIASGDLEGTYWPQVEQQLLVSGAARALFTACDGKQITAQLWYESKPERRAALIAGWKQFAEDMANYQHVEAAPVATAAPINELPALMVEITGSVTASNLVQWKEIVTERIAGINTDLQTDTDFANADAMVKFLDDGEKRIDLVKSQAQANAADIDRVFRALDEIKASMRAKRLELDKLVKARKENIRGEIAREGLARLNDHVDMLNKRLGRKLIQPAGDFHAAIKGRRTVQSLRDACDSELARAKIAANEQADRIQINLNAYAGTAAGYEFLFSDLDALVLKDADGFAAIINQRIDHHVRAEAERVEAERAKIRAEEEARAAAKVKADQEAEDALIAGFWANARRIEFDSVPYIQKAINAFECMAPDWENDPRPRVAAAVADARKEMQDKLAVAKAKAEQEARDKIAAENMAAEKEFSARIATEAEANRAKCTAPLPAPAESNGGRLDETAGGAAQPGKPVITIDGPFTSDIQIPKLDDGARIRLGEISDRLGFTVTADFISSLGFDPVETVKAAKMYRESDFIPIVSSLIDRLDRVRAKDWRAAA